MAREDQAGVVARVNGGGVVRGRRAWRRGGRVATGLVVGLVATGVVIVLGAISWPNYLELKLYDVRQRWFPREKGAEDVVCVLIDDEALGQVGRWPWPRRILGEFITACKEAGARQIVLDINFPEEQAKEIVWPGVTDVGAYDVEGLYLEQGEPEVVDNDALLAEAMRAAGDVVLPFYAPLGEGGTRGQNESQEAVDEINRQMRSLLTENPDMPFSQAYAKLRPGVELGQVDPVRTQYRQAYVRWRAMASLERFGWPASDQIAAMAKLAEPTPSIPSLAAAAGGTGYVTFEADSDGVVRRMPLLAEYEGRVYPQLALAGLLASGQRPVLTDEGRLRLETPEGVRDIPLDEEGNLLIRWSRDWGGEGKYISVLRVLKVWDVQRAMLQNEEVLSQVETLGFQLATVPEDLSEFNVEMREQIGAMRARLAALPSAVELRATNEELAVELTQVQERLRERLAGKIVLLGSSATGAPDFVVTPLGSRTPGVVVHQQILGTLTGETLQRAPWPRWSELTVVALLGLVMTVVATCCHARYIVAALGGLVGVFVVADFWLMFDQLDTWFAAMSPVGGVLAAFSSVTFYRAVTEGRERFRITSRFKQYVSPAVVDQIVEQHRALSLAGEQRWVTCFFSDLAGFTTISEQLGPEKTVRVLNVYLDRMTGVLDEHEATVNKFLGDGVFAFFGAPIEQEDHCLRACEAALDAQRQLTALIGEQQAEGEEFPELRMRIGLSTGPVVVGDCGSHRRFDYTAIGDTVNLGARLESANKAFGTQVLLCRYTRERAGEAVATRYLGRVRVVGKEQGVPVHELLGRTEEVSEEERAYSQRFETGVQAYEQGRFDEAVQVFAQCLEWRPEDKAAKLFLTAAQAYQQEGPPAGFAGWIELEHK